MGAADCEGIRSGWLAQPANAMSSLTYLAVGAWLLWQARASGVRRSALLVVGLAMMAVGVGSFTYHGPQPGWAHAIHNASILVLTLVMAGDHVWLLVRVRRIGLLMRAWRPAAPWIVLAFVGYWAGRTASPLCSPSSVWQPHAAWHALSALGLGLAVMGCAQHHQRLGADDLAGTP